MKKPWRPSGLIVASLACHALALPVVWLEPATWPVVLACLVADHLLVMGLSLWPRSQVLGPNMSRLPNAAVSRGEVAITIDDGPDPEVTPEVLRVLAAQGVPATFFCIGERARAHSELCRQACAEGHDVENHGQRHPVLASLMGPGGWRQEVEGGAFTLESITGRRPRFYRAVAGLRNPWLDPVLHRLGLKLASWTRRGFDTRSQDPDVVLRRLTTNLRAGDILLLHDGHAARTRDGVPVIVEVLPRLITAIRAQGLTPVTLSQACKQS
jgi:peptidoglycan/xylan/chitin deacetylase (PgdA/CDA1 family)